MPIMLKDNQGVLTAPTPAQLAQLVTALGLEALYVPAPRSFADTSALEAALPSASSKEGMTALVGPSGSKVEYILLNGTWQKRAVIIIAGAV